MPVQFLSHTSNLSLIISYLNNISHIPCGFGALFMAIVSLCTLMHIKHSKNDIPHKGNVPLINVAMPLARQESS
jgi:phosphate starvation-inducible membrane PsiE